MVRTKGWIAVAFQAVLLGLLIVLPARQDWATPTWVEISGIVIVIAGLALVLIAASGLGSSLTPTPVPKASGELITTGLFQHVRHPIYSGVLFCVVGITIRSGSLPVLGVACTTIVFFNIKARWEETQLAAHYPTYDEYASRTPRFIPKP